MSDTVELVIKIPKEDWEFIKESDGCRWSRAILDGVINGIPLPEPHGDLIDRKELLADTVYAPSYAVRSRIYNAETIIPATEKDVKGKMPNCYKCKHYGSYDNDDKCYECNYEPATKEGENE